MPNANDEELFMRFVKNKDQNAFETIVKRYEPILYGYLVRYTGDANLAEDIFQETFVKVFEKCHLYCADRPFKPWLFCIAINTAKDKFRERRSYSYNVNTHENIVVDNGKSPACEFDTQELKEIISQAVAHLSEVQRQVFILRTYEQLSYVDISDIVQRPLNTVKSDMRRALQSLRGLLNHLADI